MQYRTVGTYTILQNYTDIHNHLQTLKKYIYILGTNHKSFTVIRLKLVLLFTFWLSLTI